MSSSLESFDWRDMRSLWVWVSLISLSLEAEGTRLRLLHYNDFHSRFQPIDREGGDCSPEENERQECFGGFARLKSKIEEVQKRDDNVLLLNAGDYFTGTLWYTVYGWKVVAYFLGQLKHTALSLGLHEFDDGVAGLVPFLEAFSAPILSSNILDANETSFQNKYNKSIVLKVDNTLVGIVGYTTVDVLTLASPGKLDFTDPVKGVEAEAKKLHEQGIKIIIALGHAGIKFDLEIAEIPYVDVVVGGLSSLFTYTGTPPESEVPYGPYPIVVRQKAGTSALVVTAFSFGKYLGMLDVEFDNDGVAVKWSGNPILLDNTISEDAGIVEQLGDWQKNITSVLNQEVGLTKVYLDGRYTNCRTGECNMGNILADSMVFMALEYANDFEWNSASMALQSSGSIRGSIEERKRNGVITMGDIYEVLPFRNTMVQIQIKGEYLRGAFEYSVSEYDLTTEYPSGKFLQVSGVRVTFDMCEPIGGRVKEIQVLCNECRVPSYVQLEEDFYYTLVIPTFMAEGGDGFTIISDNVMSKQQYDSIDADILINYMKVRGPLMTGIEQRVLILNPKQDCSNSASSVVPIHGIGTLRSSLTSLGYPKLTVLLVLLFKLILMA